MGKIKKQSGFTLVELIMVIVIIAILAAIAISKFTTINTNAKNASDDYTIRKLEAVISLLYMKSQADGSAAWPTGAEVANQVPNLGMTTTFVASTWRYQDDGDTVIFYCGHGTQAISAGRRWWTYYRVDSGSYKAGRVVEGSSNH